jgi:hypothetical protein
MRCVLLLTLLSVSACLQPPQNNLGYSELVGRYEARFEVEGDILTVEVLNPGGLNIVNLDAVVRDDVLYLGGRRASSGPEERRRLSLNVSPFDLGPLWYERVFWAEFNDQPATKLKLVPRNMPVREHLGQRR